MTFRFGTIKVFLAFGAYAMASALCAFGQDVIQMGTLELKNEATALIGEKRYVEARPYMHELIKRINDSTDATLKAQLEELYYFDAFSYLQENLANPSDKLLMKAIEGFDKVINNYPTGEFARLAIDVKASCYDGMKKYAQATETREKLLQRPFVDKLNNKQQLDVIRKIATSLYALREWKLGEKWFDLLLQRSSSVEDKSLAASGLIQTAVEKKNYDAVKKYLPYMVYNTPTRSDIALNVAFLKAGDALVKAEKYGDATLFYSMVFGKETIEKNLALHLERAKKVAANAKRINSPNAADLEVKVKLIESQLEAMKGIQSYAVDLMARSARNYMLTERSYESFWSYWQLLRAFPDHQNIEDFYYAAFIGAYQIGKLDEMFKLGEEYLGKFPDGQYVRDIQLYTAQYYLQKKDYDSFFALAMKFIEEYNDDSQGADMIFLMGKAWFDTGKYSDVIKTFGEYIKNYPDTAIMEACMYWSGMAYMAQGKFKEATKILVKMIDDYPNGTYSEDGAYRRGVAAFGAGEFEIARDTLEDFIAKFPKSKLRGEAEFFLGDIYANVNEVDLALKHYKAVELYTKNQSFIDNAYMQAAKLLHNVDRYEEESDLMDVYIERFPKGIRSEASFNKAKAKEMMGLPADALAIYKDAIVKYGANPKDDGVDKMILDFDRMCTTNLEKLKATVEFLNKLLTDDKMATVRRANNASERLPELLYFMVEVPAKRYRYFQDNPKIDKRLYEKFKRDKAFGANLYKDKTILKNLFDRYSAQIAAYPQGGTEKVFNDILSDALKAKNNTLAFRIMMGLDSIGKPVKYDKMFTADDLKNSSVRTLVWIAKINEKYGADEARKAFREARNRDEYDYLIDVMFGEAALEERQTNWDRVLAIYQEIQDNFPSDERAADAALAKADAFAKLGKHDKAIAEYESVLRTPAWRGNAHAEALYKLGKIAQLDSKIDAALMYYDRCYLGFANCYKWTGKALLSAAQLLSAQNNKDKAKEICDEFLGNKLNEASPDFSEIKQYRLTL